MSLTPNEDYVLCAKTTRMSTVGVVMGLVVGLSDCLIVLPHKALSGAGLLHRRTTYTLSDGPPLQAVRTLLADPEMTLDLARQVLRDLAATTKAGLVVDLPGLAALRVKTGWFSRGIYYRQPGDRGWSGLPLADGAATAKDFARFYADQLRE